MGLWDNDLQKKRKKKEEKKMEIINHECEAIFCCCVFETNQEFYLKHDKNKSKPSTRVSHLKCIH